MTMDTIVKTKIVGMLVTIVVVSIATTVLYLQAAHILEQEIDQNRKASEKHEEEIRHFNERIDVLTGFDTKISTQLESLQQQLDTKESIPLPDFNESGNKR